jgi:predicted nuclease of predicted toxin-antitoxin system
LIRFLANENIPQPSVLSLRADGHDVYAVVEQMPGATDREVLAVAASEGRIILTFDRDYGELLFRLRLPAPPGVLYLRFVPAHPEEAAERVLELLSLAALTLDGLFTVLDRDGIRQRRLP